MFEIPQSEIEANRSKSFRVVVGHPNKQTDRQTPTDIITLYISRYFTETNLRLLIETIKEQT